MLQLYKNIKNRRLQLHMTQTELAKRTGYADKSMIARIEAGTVDLPHSKIEIFAKALNMPASDLMGWDSPDLSKIKNVHTPGARRVPILGTICAGNGVFCEENYKGYFFLDSTIECDFIVDVKGDSMEDIGIFDGDKVMIIQSYDYLGKICAVLLTEYEEAVLKRVDAGENQYVLSSYNKKYKPMLVREDEMHILGECIGVYHGMR